MNPLNVFSENFFLGKRFSTSFTDMLEGVDVLVVNVSGEDVPFLSPEFTIGTVEIWESKFVTVGNNITRRLAIVQLHIHFFVNINHMFHQICSSLGLVVAFFTIEYSNRAIVFIVPMFPQELSGTGSVCTFTAFEISVEMFRFSFILMFAVEVDF